MVALADQSRSTCGGRGRAAISASGIGHRRAFPLFEARDIRVSGAQKAAYEGWRVRFARSGGAGSRQQWSEKDTRVLNAMAFAFASAGRDGVTRVLDALTDRSRADDALGYLVELGQPHVAAVAARLSDPNPVVREQIAVALGFIGGPEAAAALTAAIRAMDPDVRHAIDVAQVRTTRSMAVPTQGGQ